MYRMQTGSSCQGLRHNRVAMKVIVMGVKSLCYLTTLMPMLWL